MTTGEHTPGEPLAPDDPEVLAFRALRGADEVAQPDTLRHYEVTLKGIVGIATTPEEAVKAAAAALRQETHERERELVIDVMKRSGTLTEAEFEALQAGTADKTIHQKVNRSMHNLAIRRLVARRLIRRPGS